MTILTLPFTTVHPRMKISMQAGSLVLHSMSRREMMVYEAGSLVLHSKSMLRDIAELRGARGSQIKGVYAHTTQPSCAILAA